MGTNIPATLPELIAWADTHSTLWMANAVAIGLTAAQATAFKGLVTSLDNANLDAEAKRQASRDATLTLNGAVASVRGVGGAYVNLIKAFAETTHNNTVYTLAGVSPDSAPSTLPPPTAPVNFTAEISSEGALLVKWKASQPAGVTGVQYRVKRRLNGETEFTLIDTVGSIKKFLDKTLPFGVDRVDYIIEPVRGNVVGPQSNTFSLQFGMIGGGGAFSITNAVESGPTKLAA